MKKIFMLLIVFAVLISGCDYYFHNRKYTGKVFDVRVEFWEGNKAKVEIWKNANELSYNTEEHIYTFYVDGKLVEINNASSVVLTEIGAQKPIDVENKKYVGKKFVLSILHGKEVIKTWENIDIRSANSKNVQFIFDGADMNIIPSANTTIVIKEAKIN